MINSNKKYKYLDVQNSLLLLSGKLFSSRKYAYYLSYVNLKDILYYLTIFKLHLQLQLFLKILCLQYLLSLLSLLTLN